MKSFHLFTAAVLAVLSARAETFSPESTAVCALRQNRDLVAARFLIAEAEGRLVQAGLWNNPELKAGGEFGTRNDRDWEAGAGFMQAFPLAGRLRKATEVARVDVALAIEELRNRERMLAGQVLGKARALLIQDRKLAINQENRELLERILRQTAALTATGKAGVADGLVIELEQTTLGLARDALIVERRAMVAEINGLLGRQPGAAFFIAGEIPAVPSPGKLQAAAATAVERRPDRRLATLEADRSFAEEKLARAGKWENLNVGFDLGRERQLDMESTMVGLEFSVPLPLWNRNQGRIAEAQAAQQRTLAAVAARDLAIATEIREAETRLTGLAAILKKTRGPALDLARRNTELLEQNYASGTSSFLTIYEGGRQQLMLEQSAVETEEMLVAALTDWEVRTMHFPAPVLAAITATACGGAK